MTLQKFTVQKHLKRLGYLLAILCGLGAGFLALLLLINLPVFDEDLHPDLVAFPRIDAPPPVDGNAYYGLMGFRAAPGKDFIATGQALVRRYLDNHAAGTDMLTTEDREELLGADALYLEPLPCSLLSPGCSLQQLSMAVREGDYDSPQMDLALQRYDALLALPTLQYMSATTVMTPPPSYGPLLETQRYKLIERYNTGSSTALLNHVAADLRFWKRLLREGRWVLDKMVAVGALWTDMQLLSAYMTEHELSAEDRALIDSVLIPLNAEERDIGEAFLAEARDLHSLLEYLHTRPKVPQGIMHNVLQLQLMLPNASTNQRYTDMLKPLIDLSRLSAADYARTLDAPEYKAWGAEEHKLGISLRNLYNLGGKLLFANESWPQSDKYSGRVHDLESMMLAVRLQFELKGTAREQLAASIANSSITQPYTGAAFAYDAAEGWLTFECRDDYSRTNSRCRVKL